jgi:hypothetical protein
MNGPKKLLVTGVALASLSGATLLVTPTAFARPKDVDTLANTIAARFHLKEDEVKTILEQYASEHQINLDVLITAQLDKAVTEGTLTGKQEADILAKRTELKTKMAEIRAMPDKTARRTAIRELIKNTKQWAKDNTIPLRWLAGSARI